jgi:hypothetical protein
MSDDNSSSWSFDLDAKDAESTVQTLQTGLQSIGATDMSELAASITEIGTVVGVVGAAVLAIGESFKLVMDAEEIDAVNKQFEMLAKNAGQFGEGLKSALETSAGGLVDETTLLKGASGALVELGQNAGKLPQIMDLARKATMVFGGDLMSNFNGITQAIASGNMRMLKHMGIIVDTSKVYADYAKSIGVATDELSDAGKQHALLNAVLAKGQTAFSGVDVSIKATTNAWQEFKAAMKDVGDSMAIVWNKIAGPAVRSSMKFLADSAHYLSNMLKSALGTGSEAAAASVENLTTKLEGLKAKQAMLAKDAATNKLYDPSLLASTNKQIAETTAELEKQNVVLKQSTTEAEKKFEAEKKSGDAITKDSEVDLEKRKANQLKFHTDLDKLRMENEKAEMKSATSIAQVDALTEKEKQAVHQQTADKLKQLELQQGLSAKQRAQMTVQIKKQEELQIDQITSDQSKNETNALNNLENENASVAQKVGNAWAAESAKAGLEMKDFTKLATGSFQAVGDSATSAFEALGDGSETAGEAMKGFLFGALGSIAEQAGAVMLLEGLWPPNPVAIAGGGALLALGGYLKGQAKGATGASPNVSASAGGGDTGSGVTSSTQPSTDSSSSGPSTTQNPSASVSFTVQGNLYSSNEAKLEMMDIMRSATDATDFKYTQVGGGT